MNVGLELGICFQVHSCNLAEALVPHHMDPSMNSLVTWHLASPRIRDKIERGKKTERLSFLPYSVLSEQRTKSSPTLNRKRLIQPENKYQGVRTTRTRAETEKLVRRSLQ